MKYDELKAQVYKLAEVSTTQQLKAKYEAIKVLDMRRTASWYQAFTILQAQKNEFQRWLANPPNEYRELFAEIDLASQECDQKLIEAKQLAAEVITIAGNLEELAKEHQGEADTLKRELKAAQRIAKRAELN